MLACSGTGIGFFFFVVFFVFFFTGSSSFRRTLQRVFSSRVFSSFDTVDTDDLKGFFFVRLSAWLKADLC